MSQDIQELLDAYMAQEQMHSLEGRRGVWHICKIAEALGYHDSTYFGQLPNGASVGSLLAMLEDNSGLMEAMVEWIKTRNFSEFREPLEALVEVEGAAVDQYEGGVCPDCGEEINPTSVRGDECDNCGHVFNWGESDDIDVADAQDPHDIEYDR